MKLLNNKLIINCSQCDYFEKGFLSEPNECTYFNEPYMHSIPGVVIPKWCPLPNYINKE